MFSLGQVDRAVVSLGSVDDTAFTSGDTAAWATVFRDAVRTARQNGAILRGVVRIAPNMIPRIIGESAPSPEGPLQLLTALSLEYDQLEIWVDQSLPVDTVVLD